MTRQQIITEFLRAQASWRLANAGCAPVPAAQCAAALLDAATYAATLSEDDPDLAALERGGCFRGSLFDPGPRGMSLARWWQYGAAAQAGPRDLIAALAVAAGCGQAGSHGRPQEAAGPAGAAARLGGQVSGTHGYGQAG